MVEQLAGALESPTIVTITAVLFVTGSITTFDMRLIQAKKAGVLSPDDPQLPPWVFVFYVLHYGLLVVLFIIWWRYALLLTITLFILKVLPVLAGR